MVDEEPVPLHVSSASQIAAAARQTTVGARVRWEDIPLRSLDFTPDGSRAYVGNYSREQLLVIDTVSRTLLTTIPITTRSVGVAVTPDGAKVYVGHELTPGLVTVISTATNSVLTTISVGNRTWATLATLDGSRVYVASAASLSVIDTVTDTVVTTIPGIQNAVSLSLTPDGSQLYIVEQNRGLKVLDVATNTITATIPIDRSPTSYGRFIGPAMLECGNGIRQYGEQCDDGNTFGGDCCSATCQFEERGLPCANDGNECTGDQCDGAGGRAHAALPAGAACASDDNVCTNDECDGFGACDHLANASACDDGIFCNGGDVCSDGVCAHSGDPCAGNGQCTDNCDEDSGSCQDPDGTPCDDGLACTINDACLIGACFGDSSTCGDGTVQQACAEQCDDGNTGGDDGCDERCLLEPCAATPNPACKPPFVAGKAGLKLTRHLTKADKKTIFWNWSSGTVTDKAEFGDPLGADDYWLCLYDEGALVSTTKVAAGGTCNGKPCWTEKPTGFQFRDKAGVPDGASKLALKAGGDGKAKARFKGTGDALAVPDLAAITGPVIVQLIRSSGGAACWTATYSAPFTKDDGQHLSDKAD